MKIKGEIAVNKSGLTQVFLLLLSILYPQNWVSQLNKEFSPAVAIVGNLQNGELVGFGSGFNISIDGSIVTNYHVVEGANQIKVQFKNGDIFEGQYYSFVDKDKDFVIIKIAGFDLPTVKFGNSNKVNIGDEVIAIGNPKGAWHSVTKGIVSQIVDFGSFKMFQTDVFIGTGSSGGPLFNNKKEIIGVTTAGLEEGLDINYAIPINYIRGAKNNISYNSRKNIGFDSIKSTYRQPTYREDNSTKKSTKTSNIETENSNSSSNNNSTTNENMFYGCSGLYCIYLLILGLLPP